MFIFPWGFCERFLFIADCLTHHITGRTDCLHVCVSHDTCSHRPSSLVRVQTRLSGKLLTVNQETLVTSPVTGERYNGDIHSRTVAQWRAMCALLGKMTLSGYRKRHLFATGNTFTTPETASSRLLEIRVTVVNMFTCLY